MPGNKNPGNINTKEHGPARCGAKERERGGCEGTRTRPLTMSRTRPRTMSGDREGEVVKGRREKRHEMGERNDMGGKRIFITRSWALSSGKSSVFLSEQKENDKTN